MNGRDENGVPIMEHGRTQDPEEVYYLGHHCDEWVIGDKKDVEAFIKQLQELVEKTEQGKQS